MLTTLRHALTSPVTGPVAMAVALALAVALGLAERNHASVRADLEAQIVQLTRASAGREQLLRTQLDTCQADQVQRVRALSAPARSREEARRLLSSQPQGIDACARMESADAAVMANLKE